MPLAQVLRHQPIDNIEAQPSFICATCIDLQIQTIADFGVAQSPHLDSPLGKFVLHVLYEVKPALGTDHHLVNAELSAWFVVIMKDNESTNESSKGRTLWSLSTGLPSSPLRTVWLSTRCMQR